MVKRPIRIVVSFIIVFFQIIICLSQDRHIKGVVEATDSEPVAFANIVATETGASSRTITYTSSDESGRFEIHIPVDVPIISINVTAIGYTERNMTLRLDTVGQLILILTPSTIALMEVEVKARAFTDTLQIAIDSMNLSKSATLRDILNKTEGIILGDEGGIMFQGKQINKVLINGKEVFLNQNKIALDNLNYEIMDHVQIINNHKDKFTLDFNRIRDPVINIGTKPEFNGVIKTQLDAGYGLKNKYKVNAKGFYFSDQLNVFATSHNNNVGEKQLNQKDVSAYVSNYSSRSFNNALYPFFVEDYQTTKNVVSNNSLTLRREGTKDKAGLVVYHGKMIIERDMENSTFIADTLVKNSRSTTKQHGDFVAATGDYNRILSPKTIIQNVINTVMVWQKQTRINLDTIFVPVFSHFLEETMEAPKNLTLTNSFVLSHLLADRTALETGLDYYYEHDQRDLDTRLLNSGLADIQQEATFSKHQFSAFGKLKLGLRRVSLQAGTQVTGNLESAQISNYTNSQSSTNLSRDVITLSTPLKIEGSLGKLDYLVSTTPNLIHTSGSSGQGFLKLANTLTYNFAQQSNLILEVKRDYRFFDLNLLLDTIIRSYNQQIFNDSRQANRLSTREDISLGWYHSNAAKSNTSHITYRIRKDSDFLQSTLDSITDNVFYYSNRVFDRQFTHYLDAGGKKGFYLGKAYHRFELGGNLNVNIDRYSTLINNLPVQAHTTTWNPSLHLGLAPRHFFIKEINNNLDWNYLQFKLGGEEVSDQSVITDRLSLKGHGRKTDWRFEFEYRFYNVNSTRFNVPDCNLSMKYELTEHFGISLAGRSLLTLLNLNNYNFVNTLSDGNTLIRTTTANNLGYLILQTSLKF